MEQFSIAKTRLKLERNVQWKLDSRLQFVDTRAADWQVRRTDLKLQPPAGEVLFDSLGSWSAHAGPQAHITDFILYTITEGQRLVRARMQINDHTRDVQLNWAGRMGWVFPLDELFFLNAFSLHNTLLIHGMSLIFQKRGYIFCGVSGAGKSTLGQILENAKHHVLCDERNAIVCSGRKPQLYSTPFYGTSEKAFAGQAPLAGIVVLNPQHRGCSLMKLTPAEALPFVYPTVFFPQYSREKINSTLNTLEQVLTQVPLYHLNYNKSQTDVVAFLADALFSHG